MENFFRGWQKSTSINCILEHYMMGKTFKHRSSLNSRPQIVNPSWNSGSLDVEYHDDHVIPSPSDVDPWESLVQI